MLLMSIKLPLPMQRFVRRSYLGVPVFYNFKNALRAERQILPLNGSFDPQGIFDLAFHFDPDHLFVALTTIKRMTFRAKVSGLICEFYIIAVMVQFGPIFI